MQLDLQRDFKEIYAHLADRVRNFKPDSNDGPGVPGPVKLIEAGFNYSQGGWLAVVFDTRPNAEPDGEWNSHIDGNAFERPHWQEAGEANIDEPITVVHWDGKKKELPARTELAELLGELIKAVLLKARADGVFAKLPKAPGCELGVEHQEGHYGWPAYEDRGKENIA